MTRPSIILFTVRTAHILPHIVQVPSFSGGALSNTLRGRTRIDCERELLFPVHATTGIRHARIALARARDTLRNIGRMSCDLRRDKTLAHIMGIGKAKVFGRRDVAQEVCARACRDGSADSCGDVVVSRGDVGHKRAEHVDGALWHRRFSSFMFAGNLIDCHMPRPLDHDLHARVHARLVSLPISMSSEICPASVAS